MELNKTLLNEQAKALREFASNLTPLFFELSAQEFAAIDNNPAQAKILCQKTNFLAKRIARATDAADAIEKVLALEGV